MTREILFKALRSNGKEWVEGVPYFLNVTEDVPEDSVNKACIIKWVDWDGTCGFMSPENRAFIEVIPETVCQFTGLTDKNGVKVFEGDKLTDGNYTGVIRFSNGVYALCFDEFSGSRYLFELNSSIWSVIGSIHDKK